MWKNLFDQFRRTYYQCVKKKSGSGLQDIQQILSEARWHFFSQLMFLRDMVERRSTTTNLTVGDEFSLDEELNTQEDFSPEARQLEIEIPSSSASTTPSPQVSSPAAPATLPGNSSRSSKRSKRIQDPSDLLLKEFLGEINQTNQVLLNNNDTKKVSSFALYVQDLMDDVPQELKRLCEKEVIDTMYRYIRSEVVPLSIENDV